jgi:hypothetical protein
MTLSQLAAFIAGGELGEIVFVNVNGFTSTVGNNGYSYHHDADQSYNAALDYSIDSNGIHVNLAASGYTKRFEANGNSVLFSKTTSGLVDKVEIFENYMQISHQTRNGANVITHTSRIAWDYMRTPEVRVMQDENNYIPIKWDSTNSEFVIWDRSNDTGKVVAVPKFHAHGNATFEKDVTIAADLDITKTLEVMLSSEFHGQVECDEYLISKKGLQSKGMTSVERLNMGSNKSYFGVSTNSSINALLAGTAIDVSVGDIVVLHNTGNSDITVTLGTRQGSGGEETKSTTLKSLCAMQFMCCYKSGGYTHWVPAR